MYAEIRKMLSKFGDPIVVGRGLGITLGIVIGAVIGAVTGNLALWIGMGVVFGIVVGVVSAKQCRMKTRNEEVKVTRREGAT
ncbi:MAG: hypothetical protein O7D33_05630 [Chloroflexi bacterium]|nr:hypothetical protein [Chloroflexota bacterium]